VTFEFRLPDIGEGLAEAEVVEWFVEPGQAVGLDQPLVQVETDKAVTDIPSPRAGTLVRQGAAAGEVVKVGEILAVIAEEGERAASDAAPIVGSLAEADDEPPEVSRPSPGRAAGPVPETAEDAAVDALPVVRRLAPDLGVDLRQVRGTGPEGRITRDDLEAAAAAGGTTEAGEERVRLSLLRRTIARKLTRSWQEIPHVTTFGEADATRLLETRRALAAGWGRPLPMEALLMTSVLPALRGYPEFNATLEGDDLVLKRHYDLGMAVDTSEGLIVAVVRQADHLDLAALAGEVARLGDATRSRTVSTAEITGATFTISNIGAVGGGHGTPIIPYGTTAILSFGRIRQQAVARDHKVEIAPMLPLSLSYDHRVIDGALGRRFLAKVTEDLEQPAAFRFG
jgi:pyruvate dehydrogenase E2 component (dihydrolipoamide acetyltransferase)